MQVAACACVGIVWGCTNSFIKQGSLAAECHGQAKPHHSRYAVVDLWFCLLTTWRFFLPQALNLAGSVCFTALLGTAPLSFVVPVTNAVSLLANAVTDWALGETVDLAYAAPGVLLLALGVGLCAS